MKDIRGFRLKKGDRVVLATPTGLGAALSFGTIEALRIGAKEIHMRNTSGLLYVIAGRQSKNMMIVNKEVPA